MICHKKLGKWLINGLLLIIIAVLLSLFLLNIVNPNLPVIKCIGESIGDESILHKYRGDTITTTYLLLITFIIPFIQILSIELLKPNFSSVSSTSEVNPRKRALTSTLKLYRDFIFGATFTLFINDVGKTTLNNPRPHFVDSCKPNFTASNCINGWLSDYSCTNENISRWRLADSHKSFPSGHAALAMYSAIFMIMYQNSRLSMRRHGSIVVLWCHMSWLAWAFFCSLSRISDSRHHPIDVLVGGVIGGIGGAYISLYLCSAFVPRYEHSESSGEMLERYMGNSSPSGNMGPQTILANGGGNSKRFSLRRLMSNQSSITQMSDIAEDREMERV